MTKCKHVYVLVEEHFWGLSFLKYGKLNFSNFVGQVCLAPRINGPTMH